MTFSNEGALRRIGAAGQGCCVIADGVRRRRV